MTLCTPPITIEELVNTIAPNRDILTEIIVRINVSGIYVSMISMIMICILKQKTILQIL